MRVHLLDALVLSELVHHLPPEVLLLRILLPLQLQLELLQVLVGSHHLHAVAQSLLQRCPVGLDPLLLGLLEGQLDLQLQHLLFLGRISLETCWNILSDYGS